MITMYDAIYPQYLPKGASAYAGYVDGRWPTYPQLKSMFPDAKLLSIAVFPQNHAECLDIEKGDATPQQAPDWVKMELHRGVHRPAVYCSVSLMRQVLTLLEQAGIKRSEVRLWSAHYTLVAHICGPTTCAYPGAPACDGTQWTNEVNNGNVDESLMLDSFFSGPPQPPSVNIINKTTGDALIYLPNGANTEVEIPIPGYVLGATGPAAPVEVRFSAPAPISFEYSKGGADTGVWVLVHVDAARSPQPISLATTGDESQGSIKIRRVDNTSTLVLVDFR